LLEPIEQRQKRKKEKKSPLSPMKNYMKQFRLIEDQMEEPNWKVQDILSKQMGSQKLLLEEMITLGRDLVKGHLKKSRGSSGAVKKMLHVPSLQVYACKEEPLTNKEARMVLKDWIQFMQQNPHRNLVQIYGSFWNTPEGCVSILTDQAHTSLQVRLLTQELLESVGSLPENVVQIVSYCLLQALRQLHQSGQCHGYLLPSQVLFFEDGIKLSMGISARNHQEHSKKTGEQPSVSLLNPSSLSEKNVCLLAK